MYPETTVKIDRSLNQDSISVFIYVFGCIFFLQGSRTEVNLTANHIDWKIGGTAVIMLHLINLVVIAFIRNNKTFLLL